MTWIRIRICMFPELMDPDASLFERIRVRIRNTVKNGLNLIHVNQTDHYSIFTSTYIPHRHGTGA